MNLFYIGYNQFSSFLRLPSPPSGCFFPVISTWPLLGPLSAEPVNYTDIAGSCKAGKIAAENPTRLAGIREAAANVGDNALKKDSPVRA